MRQYNPTAKQPIGTAHHGYNLHDKKIRHIAGFFYLQFTTTEVLVYSRRCAYTATILCVAIIGSIGCSTCTATIFVPCSLEVYSCYSGGFAGVCTCGSRTCIIFCGRITQIGCLGTIFTCTFSTDQNCITIACAAII